MLGAAGAEQAMRVRIVSKANVMMTAIAWLRPYRQRLRADNLAMADFAYL